MQNQDCVTSPKICSPINLYIGKWFPAKQPNIINLAIALVDNHIWTKRALGKEICYLSWNYLHFTLACLSLY